MSRAETALVFGGRSLARLMLDAPATSATRTAQEWPFCLFVCLFGCGCCGGGDKACCFKLGANWPPPSGVAQADAYLASRPAGLSSVARRAVASQPASRPRLCRLLANRPAPTFAANAKCVGAFAFCCCCCCCCRRHRRRCCGWPAPKSALKAREIRGLRRPKGARAAAKVSWK